MPTSSLASSDASQESLVVLDKLITLVQAEEVVLLMPKQAPQGSIGKNRDKKINDLLREFEKQRSFEAVPLLVREDPDFKEIHKLHNQAAVPAGARSQRKFESKLRLRPPMPLTSA